MTTRRSFVVYGTATMAGLALPSLPAFAQRQDDGGFQILQAIYGTPARNVDVTDRLQRIARRDRTVRITNDLFGVDPAPGEVKILRIYARGRGNRERVFEYREDDVIDGSMFTGWNGGRWGGRRGGWENDRARIDIERASYGDGRRRVDVTGRLQAMARDGRIDFEVNNDNLGADPAPGRPKSLVVVYSINGQRREVRVPEQGRFRLP